MKKEFIYLFVSLLLSAGAFAQKKEYQLSCVAFYNLENFFDTIDSPDTDDAAFTPDSEKEWNRKKYVRKLKNMSRVISEIGTEFMPDGAAVIGLCEVENSKVLRDLVNTKKLKDRNYQIVHFQSPDYRGIDVGFLYQEKFFKIENTKTYNLTIEDKPRFRTREQLLVSGWLNGEKIHFIINHWPSRYGGKEQSRPKRNYAADLCRSIADSIFEIEPKANIVVMGDLNDNPTDESVKVHLRTKGDKRKLRKTDFYNPWLKLFKKEKGTLVYRGSWYLFDQILLSKNLAKKSKERKFTIHKAKIFKKKYMINKKGRYKGYPYRTYAGNYFLGGYSDHFPTYIILRKEKSL